MNKSSIKISKFLQKIKISKFFKKKKSIKIFNSLKNSYGDFSVDDLNIFNEDLFIGDFFFEKLRFFLEIFPLKMEICSLSKSEEDEDGLEMMKIYS